jgi:hypothetical protein
MARPSGSIASAKSVWLFMISRPSVAVVGLFKKTVIVLMY